MTKPAPGQAAEALELAVLRLWAARVARASSAEIEALRVAANAAIADFYAANSKLRESDASQK